MLQTRSSYQVVVVANTVAGGSIVQISNSAGWVVSLAPNSGLIGTMNVIDIGTGGSVNIINSSNWVLGPGTGLIGTMNVIAQGTGASTNIINTAGWIFNQANTGGKIILNGGSTSIINTAGWIVSVANTSGLMLQGGTALIGTMNVVAQGTGGSVNVINSAGWIVSVANTSGIMLQGGTALIGTMNVVAQGTGGSVNVINSAGWVVSIANTLAFWNVKVGSTSIVNSAGWVVAASATIMNSSRIVNTYDTSYVMDGTMNLTMQYSSITISNSGNTILVRAQSNTRIRVMSMFLLSESTSRILIQSGSTSPVNLIGSTLLAANVGFVLPFHPNGWFQTAADTLLNVNNASPTSMGGCLTFLTTS